MRACLFIVVQVKNTTHRQDLSIYGGVAERFKAALLKSEVGDEPAVGSNPTSTAILQRVKGPAIQLIGIGQRT